MTTVKLLLHKNWKHKDGTYPLVFQVIHLRKKKVIYTGYSVREDDFDAASQKVRPVRQSVLSGRAALRVNREIGKQRKVLADKISRLEARGVAYSVGELDAKPVPRHDVWFLEYMDGQIAAKRETANDGTAAAYCSTLRSFRRFLGGKDIRVSAVTPGLLQSYAAFLAGNKLSDNTVGYYMRNLKTIYNRIVSEGFEPACASPFKAVRTGIRKTAKRAIGGDELIRIVSLEFDPVREKHLELARDIFMFSYYCRGMAFVDVIYLRKSDIVSGGIRYSRQKGKQPVRIAVISQLQALMDKYRNDTPYVLPVLDAGEPHSLYEQYRLALGRINYALKIVGVRARLEYPLTTYTARHTWATQAKRKGISVSVISEGLGHTSEHTTQIYLKEFDTSVLDVANEKVACLI